METRHSLIATDGAILAYRRWHSPVPGHPPLLLLHGAASNLTRWSEFVALTRLGETRDILRIDLRGHGQFPFRGRLSLEQWCADLDTLLRHEDIRRVILVGHCLGANIAASFAARYPQQTAGIVLIEPMLRTALTGPLRRVRPFLPILGMVARIILLFNHLGLYRRRLATLNLFDLDREFRVRLQSPDGATLLTKRYASVLEDLKIMPTANFLQDLLEVARTLPLSSISCPSLVLLSTGRTLTDSDLARSLLSVLPDCEIQLLPARHWIPTEQPEAMRTAIEAWCPSIH